ncbi:LysR family transcriptional regulator [Bacteriovorax sp. PP10]|uniref:LysR family transcriptional regulator n=1 Tax=Bacteriovorax antarcticus TaxID=3088717 RepID=A0ABU5VTL1_9BACT|nr:LysR family transcriptional regulator [Bacteriovorax sp. PP10]MEA9355340.1 LysR family transcriptional regulator [Bacteriovorax sp. PP10]
MNEIMELSYLRVFYEVAKAGKFSETAKKLNVSQSALSRSVSLLEEGEGVVLFDRSKSGVSLTPKGLDVFRLCEQLFQTEKEIENLCRGIQDKCEGFLRFAASDHVINDLLPGPIHEFRRQHPKVVPSIRSGTPDEIVNHLLTTDCEFALMFAKINTPQIEFRRLHPESMSLVCHPDLWKECKSSSNEKTLKKLIGKYGYMSAIGASMDRRSSQVLIELFGEMPSIGFEINSQESQKRFCLAGEGVAYLTNFMVKKEIERGELFEIPVDHIHEFHMWLARPKGKQLSLTSRMFLQHLVPSLEF